MEKKPIKRSQYILPLSKDHHFTLLFCWKIRQGLKHEVEAERIKNYVAHFWEYDMQPHFLEEEEILFAPLKKDEKVAKALNDHRQIEGQVNAILQASGEETVEKLMLLADTVETHIRYEERDLFSYLESSLTQTQLEEIGRQLKEEPLLKDDYADEFWLKEK
ncbi:MAG: hemerythrin domain-containing protein [Chitinophagaceae bacterium]|nr:MAG: hemerythrin domain-containing protein [Chitinophagaceae bacterium]